MSGVWVTAGGRVWGNSHLKTSVRIFEIFTGLTTSAGRWIGLIRLSTHRLLQAASSCLKWRIWKVMPLRQLVTLRVNNRVDNARVYSPIRKSCRNRQYGLWPCQKKSAHTPRQSRGLSLPCLFTKSAGEGASPYP